MNKQKAMKKRAYVKPEIEVIKLEVEHNLLSPSEFHGDHTPVIEDAGELEEEP